jgi:hypothetical protein
MLTPWYLNIPARGQQPPEERKHSSTEAENEQQADLTDTPSDPSLDGDSDLDLIADDALNKRVRVPHTAKYVTGRADLARYLNPLVFLYGILEKPKHDIALNRIGTQRVEDPFGLMRM